MKFCAWAQWVLAQDTTIRVGGEAIVDDATLDTTIYNIV